MKACLSCHHASPDDAVFCPHCGQTFLARTICPNCKTSFSSDSLYCPACGQALNTTGMQGTTVSSLSILQTQEIDTAIETRSLTASDDEQKPSTQKVADRTLFVPPLLPDPVSLPGPSVPALPGSPQPSAIPTLPGTPQTPSVPTLPGNNAPAQPLPSPAQLPRTSLKQSRRMGRYVRSTGTTATHAGATKIITAIILCLVVAGAGIGAAHLIPHWSGSGNHVTIQTQPVPPTETSCPAVGTAHAAVFASLAQGHDDTLVYVENSTSSAMLKRYDVQTGRTTTILNEPNTLVLDAQVTPDGQWVLFDTETEETASTGNGTIDSTMLAKMQLVRLDGQGLQTLYCFSNEDAYPIDTPESVITISPDQQHIAFLTRNTVMLLTLRTGKLQQYVPTLPEGQLAGQPVFYSYPPLSWLDSTHLYLTSVYSGIDGGVPENIYALDITHGPLASANSLTLVNQTSAIFCWDYDANSARTRLYVNQCPGTQGGIIAGTSTITSQAATGGHATTLYRTSTNVITTMRVLNNNTLLFYLAEGLVNNDQLSGDTSRDGWWKINADGSGLTRLTHERNSPNGPLDDQPNTFAHTPWATVSRDAHFALINSPDWPTIPTFETQQGLSILSLTDNTITSLANVSLKNNFTAYPVNALVPAGWTTM